VTAGAWLQRLNLTYDEALSNFAFNFNLRRYTMRIVAAITAAAAAEAGRRRLNRCIPCESAWIYTLETKI